MKNNILLNNKFGIIIGFIFGLVIIPFATMGLASYTMEIAAKILVFPMRLVFLVMGERQYILEH